MLGGRDARLRSAFQHVAVLLDQALYRRRTLADAEPFTDPDPALARGRPAGSGAELRSPYLTPLTASSNQAQNPGNDAQPSICAMVSTGSIQRILHRGL